VRRGILLTVLAVAAFAVIVIARLPASWVIPSSSSVVSCAGVDGSIWYGTCTGLTAQGTALGDLVWDVHALRLLTGKLSANLALTRPTGSVQGDFDVGLDKSVTARNVQVDLPLDNEVMTLISPNLRTLRGSAHADIALAHLAKNNIITQLQGHIEVHDLEDHDRNGVTPLGSYSLTFPGGTGAPTGQLRDLGGPLAVEGTVRVMQDKPGIVLDTFITPRPDAGPQLVSQLQFLAPDAQGRRQLTTEMGF
jgi:Type II secretion system (T2SS), protein N